MKQVKTLKHQLTILCYHGVVNSTPIGYNSSGKHVNIIEFEKQIQYISRNFEIVSMRNIDDYARGKCSLPKEAVAITFDDGFANNLEIAHKVLTNYGVSATIYLATGFISRTKLIWTDSLERIILEAPIDTPSFSIGPKICLQFFSRKLKECSLQKVKKELKSCSPYKRMILLKKIEQIIGQEIKGIRHNEIHNFLTWDQVRYMKNSGIWEIGAHTVHHHSLGSLGFLRGQQEIRKSLVRVAKETKSSEVPLFSYPEGQSKDIPKYAIDYLRKMGLKSAPSAEPGQNLLPFEEADNYLRLRRILVGFENTPFPWNL